MWKDNTWMINSQLLRCGSTQNIAKITEWLQVSAWSSDIFVWTTSTNNIKKIIAYDSLALYSYSLWWIREICLKNW